MVADMGLLDVRDRETISQEIVLETVSLAVKVTMTSELFQPFALGAGVWLDVIVGGVVSFTVTLKEALALLPASSAAVQFTVVAPIAKVLPEAGVQLTEGDESTASVAVTE